MHEKNETLCVIYFYNGVVYQLGFGGDWGELKKVPTCYFVLLVEGKSSHDEL
jgi:hypothetical protein